MEKKTKYWVVYWHPGAFVADETIKDYGYTDIAPDPQTVPWPDDAYAFRVYKREDVIDDGKTYSGEAKQIGPIYYHPDSTVETLEQVKQNPKASETLISNMEGNRWKRIVWSRWGNWPQPFDPKDSKVLAKR